MGTLGRGWRDEGMRGEKRGEGKGESGKAKGEGERGMGKGVKREEEK